VPPPRGGGAARESFPAWAGVGGGQVRGCHWSPQRAGSATSHCHPRVLAPCPEHTAGRCPLSSPPALLFLGSPSKAFKLHAALAPQPCAAHPPGLQACSSAQRQHRCKQALPWRAIWAGLLRTSCAAGCDSPMGRAPRSSRCHHLIYRKNHHGPWFCRFILVNASSLKDREGVEGAREAHCSGRAGPACRGLDQRYGAGL
jgi:hypothetical protein